MGFSHSYEGGFFFHDDHDDHVDDDDCAEREVDAESGLMRHSGCSSAHCTTTTDSLKLSLLSSSSISIFGFKSNIWIQLDSNEYIIYAAPFLSILKPQKRDISSLWERKWNS